MLQTKPQIKEEDAAPTDEEISAGLYSYADLEARGIVRNRTDLHRKQQRYGFPWPIKTEIGRASCRERVCLAV